MTYSGTPHNVRNLTGLIASGYVQAVWLSRLTDILSIFFSIFFSILLFLSAGRAFYDRHTNWSTGITHLMPANN